MKFISIAALLASTAVSAYAQTTTTKTTTESKSTVKVEDLKDKNKTSGDIDEDVTNARMRAESGSKSKWSISTAIGWKGGSLNKGFAADRPNLSGQPGTETSTSISVDPNIRYRWSKNSSLTLGNSFAIMTPLQGKVKKGDQLNFRDPSLAYARVGKIGSLQSSGSVSFAAGTSNESRQIDNAASVGVSWTLLHSFDNGLTVGSSVQLIKSLYSSKPGGNANVAEPGYYGGDTRNEYNLGLYPFVEYAFNDTFSFRTLFGYFNYHHLYGDQNNWRLLRTFIYQSVGVGIAVSRDVYLYPNIQVVPDNLRSDFTNFALSANINVF